MYNVIFIDVGEYKNDEVSIRSTGFLRSQLRQARICYAILNILSQLEFYFLSNWLTGGYKYGNFDDKNWEYFIERLARAALDCYHRINPSAREERKILVDGNILDSNTNLISMLNKKVIDVGVRIGRE